MAGMSNMKDKITARLDPCYQLFSVLDFYEVFVLSDKILKLFSLYYL